MHIHGRRQMAEDEEVVLMGFWPSPFVLRTRITLEEKGVKYEYREEDMRNKSQLLIRMNPVHETVPVLIHNGKSVCESLIQVEYIDEVWSDNAPILPSDRYRRAQARFLADYVDKKLFSPVKKMYRGSRKEQESAKKDIIEVLEELEYKLNDKPYFGGETFGFMDIVLIPYHRWFIAYEKCGFLNIESKFLKLNAWVKMCLERESVPTVLPDAEKISQYILKFRKRLGVE